MATSTPPSKFVVDLLRLRIMSLIELHPEIAEHSNAGGLVEFLDELEFRDLNPSLREVNAAFDSAVQMWKAAQQTPEKP
jgi:hypothetical protein